LETFLEWRPTLESDIAPDDAEVWYDTPVCFEPPAHEPRFVLRGVVTPTIGKALQSTLPAMPRPRANYGNTEYRKRREERINADSGMCVFCKSSGSRLTVQHVTYRRAGGGETLEDLRTLCSLCHDAVTMLEYGLGMEMDRVNPEDPRWREKIIQIRADIIKFRSLQSKKRRLHAEEVK
jgi:hypothetical protein